MPVIQTNIFLEKAVALHNQGDLQAAIRGYEDVLKSNPNHADALNLLGLACSQLSEHEIGVQHLRAAIELKDHPMYQNNLGVVYKNMGQMEQAKACFLHALELFPEYMDAIVNLAALLCDAGATSAADDLYKLRYEAGKHRADFLSNYSKLCRELGNIDQARDLLEQLLQQFPDDKDALFNYGMLLKAQGEAHLAELTFTHLLLLLPQGEKAGQARWYLSQCQLQQQNYKQGWSDYSARFTALGLDQPNLKTPRWNGSEAENKVLLVWAEQGVGDELMFTTHIALILEKCSTIYYECDPRLLDLLARSYPEVHFFPRYSGNQYADIESLCDYQCSAGDLPMLLNPTLKPLEDRFRPLCVDKHRVENIKKQLPEISAKDRAIGFSYFTKGVQADYRMPSKEFWQSITKDIGTLLLVDLQNSQSTSIDIPEQFQMNSLLSPVDNIDLYNDIDGLAAVISLLDSVVTIDNAVAHLAGCLNIPTTTILTTVHDWRWFQKTSDCYWYPSMSLLRQKKLGDWSQIQNTIDLN